MVAQPPPTSPVTAPLTQDDRALAGLCHASIFIGFPVIAPICIYAWKKDTSRFVAFHALQAAIAHISVIPLMIAGWIFWGAATFGIEMFLDSRNMFLPFGMVGAWMIGGMAPWGLIGLISILAAYRAFCGESFRIPIIATMADRILAAPTAVSPKP